jgi:PAS domain S-box-containing protein
LCGSFNPKSLDNAEHLGILHAHCARAGQPQDGAFKDLHVIMTFAVDSPVYHPKNTPTQLGGSGGPDIFRAAFDNASVAIAILDRNGRFVKVNDAACRFLGCSREELIGTDTTRFTRPEDVASTNELRRSILRGERDTVALDKAYIRKDGKVAWGRINASLIRDANGNPESVLVFCEDITAQRRIEKALCESEAVFRALVEQLPSAIVYRASLGQPAFPPYVSPQIEKVLGYSQEEFTSVPGAWLTHIHAEDVERVKTQVAQHQRDGVPFHAEYRMRHKNGGVVWVEDVANIVRNDNGRPVCVVGVAIDITARKEAEARLRASEELLRLISDNLAGGMVYQIDSGRDGRERRFSYVSPSIERLHGLTVEDVTHDPSLLYGQVVEEDRAALAERESRAFATLTPLDIELRVRLPSGEIRWRHFVSAPRSLPDGRVVWSGIELDITGRKLAEARLRASEERYHALADALPQTVFETDAQGNLTYVNRAAYAMFGYAPQDFTAGLNCLAMVAPEDRDRAVENFRRRLLDEPVANSEYTLLMKRPFRAVIHASPIVQSGKPVGMRGLIIDVTEQRRLERLAADIARAEHDRIRRDLHDAICQDLTGIVFLAENMRAAPAGVPSEASQGLTSISRLARQALDHATHIVRGLQPLPDEPDALPQALADVACYVKDVYGIACRVTAPPAIANCDGTTATQLLLIAREAALNAAKHAQAKQIRISLAQRHGILVLRVSDNGKGFTNESAHAGMGLQAMRDRASLIGATLTIRPGRTRGTVVECHWHE